jgi:hypothetical protein
LDSRHSVCDARRPGRKTSMDALVAVSAHVRAANRI